MKKIEIKRIKLTEIINDHNGRNPDQPDTSRKHQSAVHNVSYTTLHHWDKGNTVPDAILTLYKLSKWFDRPMEDFIELKNPANE